MNIESVIDKSKTLKLNAIAEHLEQTTAVAEHRNWTPLQTIDHLFDLELELRKKNREIFSIFSENYFHLCRTG